MKLYYAPGACSLSPHIVLHEAGLAAEYEAVDVKSKVMQDGRDFRSVTPKGAVPTLVLDDGQVLTEGPAIVQYIADRRPETKLAPDVYSLERYRLQEWLNYISSEVHKPFSVMFNPAASEAARQATRDVLTLRFAFLEGSLGDRPYLMGDQFTVADASLFTILNWTIPTAVDLSPWPSLKAYHARVASRPAVRLAMREEGLIP